MKTTMNIGAMELRNLYERYMTEGLVIAGLLHFLVIGGAQALLHYYQIDDKIPTIKIYDPTIILRPDFNNKPALPTITVARPTIFSDGLPVPIPETDINPEPPSDRYSQPTEGSRTDVGVEGGTGTIISDGTSIVGDETAPDNFIPGIEKYPIVISNPSPKYPEIARRAGVEGTVFIKMWVTKEGKVKQVEIVKSTSDIFNQNAIDAAMLWKFTPAIMNNGPVSVWVTVPFNFRLN